MDDADLETPEPDDPLQPSSLLALGPSMARLALGAGWRTAQWSAGLYARAGGRLLRAAVSGESAAELLRDVGHDVRQTARELLGVTDEDERLRDRIIPERLAPVIRQVPSSAPVPPRDPVHTLRERGEELLGLSTDIGHEEPHHPAYLRILEQMAPDEARILRLLAEQGPQPSVDVRTGRPLNVGSVLIAPGINMIGPMAGARFPQRTPAYLNNLYRLGLVWFSREPLEDPLRYQVLEAQPEVLEAKRQAGRGKTIRRSIHLTPFGADFCALCLPLDPSTVERLRAGAAAGAAGANGRGEG